MMELASLLAVRMSTGVRSPRARTFLQQRRAVQSRQHQIQDDQVIATVLSKVEAGEPIFGAVDGEVGAFAQGGGHIFRQPHLVFHHQYPHNCSIAQPRLSEAEVLAVLRHERSVEPQIPPLRVGLTRRVWQFHGTSLLEEAFRPGAATALY